MPNKFLTHLVATSLLAITPFALAANCGVYEASVPTSITQGGTIVSQKALAHILVVRDAGFNAHPLDFLVFPKAIGKERFFVNQPAANPTPVSGAAVTQGPLGLATTTVMPIPPGINDHFPEPGHMVIMSNSTFYGDVMSSTDPGTVAATVAAATDIGTFSQVQNTGFSFDITQSPLNVVFARTKPDTIVTPMQFAVAQGTVGMAFVAESQEIFAGINMLIVDNTTTPATQLQYSGILEGKYIRTVNC